MIINVIQMASTRKQETYGQFMKREQLSSLTILNVAWHNNKDFMSARGYYFRLLQLISKRGNS